MRRPLSGQGSAEVGVGRIENEAREKVRAAKHRRSPQQLHPVKPRARRSSGGAARADGGSGGVPLKKLTPSGATVSTSEYGRPCHGIGSTVKPPWLPCPLPP